MYGAPLWHPACTRTGFLGLGTGFVTQASTSDIPTQSRDIRIGYSAISKAHSNWILGNQLDPIESTAIRERGSFKLTRKSDGKPSMQLTMPLCLSRHPWQPVEPETRSLFMLQ
eukprot:TRINITY_DN286_c0_g2_i1.p1 TRINITY_DN286_c0_g2~~TRINITY_DN286_c0_g2_i1.p1  ORF type:complete len:113 (-),score=4.42 TRINITY_DN286_c0_g2_i1:96-434(-)